jgi:hypothetical protein
MRCHLHVRRASSLIALGLSSKPSPFPSPREALLPTSARSVRAQRRLPTPPTIGDSTPRLRPRFNLHELRIGPAHLSDHSADFLDVCPSHSRRSPLLERPPSSSPPGTPPWAGRSGPPPASPSPPRARPRLHDVLRTRSQPRRPRYRATVDESLSTGCCHRGDVVSGEPSLLRLLKPVPHITGHLSDPRPHLTTPLLTGSGHRRRPTPWIEPSPVFPVANGPPAHGLPGRLAGLAKGGLKGNNIFS